MSRLSGLNTATFQVLNEHSATEANGRKLTKFLLSAEIVLKGSYFNFSYLFLQKDEQELDLLH